MGNNSSALAYAFRPGDDADAPLIGAHETTFSIGDMAREFGLTLRALRFYENRRLIAPRRHGHVRLYRQSDRERLVLIVQGKKLGFTLEEIRQMLAVQDHSDPSSFHVSREKCVEQIKMLERQKREIETALIELRRGYTEPYVSTLAQRKVVGP
jgi:DNA-binding transcriptional MerR regulator